MLHSKTKPQQLAAQYFEGGMINNGTTSDCSNLDINLCRSFLSASFFPDFLIFFLKVEDER